MANQFIGEIRMVGFNFAPNGWAFCNGQILPIAQNTALFGILGTTYGGNGTTTYALPNLQGMAPLGAGQGFGLSSYFAGETGGASTVSVLTSEIPSHTHALTPLGGSGEPTTDRPVGAFPARGGVYANVPDAAASLAAPSIAPVGGSVAHNNLQPYLVFAFIIALTGDIPPRP